ncbi:uncharacterized protein KY384_007995 [Bacidia gigantensis]|uniref:uncharacterized protein n=1 Tax=Bacidia gigantensis TaxID=2732470 RepID=UPI001D03B82B|nr:uncharacterized protein KY384_007995 [Bacidia gigantensis]KAG8527251.1 hypothetical protein KY384_007995 [Bacidia gigantensis]
MGRRSNQDRDFELHRRWVAKKAWVICKTLLKLHLYAWMIILLWPNVSKVCESAEGWLDCRRCGVLPQSEVHEKNSPGIKLAWPHDQPPKVSMDLYNIALAPNRVRYRIEVLKEQRHKMLLNQNAPYGPQSGLLDLISSVIDVGDGPLDDLEALGFSLCDFADEAGEIAERLMGLNKNHHTKLSRWSLFLTSHLHAFRALDKFFNWPLPPYLKYRLYDWEAKSDLAYGYGTLTKQSMAHSVLVREGFLNQKWKDFPQEIANMGPRLEALLTKEQHRFSSPRLSAWDREIRELHADLSKGHDWDEIRRHPADVQRLVEVVQKFRPQDEDGSRVSRREAAKYLKSEYDRDNGLSFGAAVKQLKYLQSQRNG